MITEIPITTEKKFRDHCGARYTNPFYKSVARAASAVGLAVLPCVFGNPAAAYGTRTAWFAIRAARTPALRGRQARHARHARHAITRKPRKRAALRGRTAALRSSWPGFVAHYR